MAFEFFNRDRKSRTASADPGRIPPGQVLTEKWPVLHYGNVPRANLKTWDFQVFGEVDARIRLTWDEFQQLPRTTVPCDIHCVTRWSRLNNTFEGVALKDLFALIRPKPDVTSSLVHAEIGFTANILLADLLQPNVILADTHDGVPLAPEHGWPLRLVVPHLYFWKSAKWVRSLELLRDDQPGFWEQYGYHMRGDPWKEERYS